MGRQSLTQATQASTVKCTACSFPAAPRDGDAIQGVLGEHPVVNMGARPWEDYYRSERIRAESVCQLQDTAV